MSRNLLDTSALIDFLKNRPAARAFLLEAIDSGDVLGVSPINVAEFYAGLEPQERAN
jgi:predicted nucleic acid-binding protein